MIDTSDGKCWVGRAPAKLNLFFEVLGKRSDGYHDVCSVCVPVSLCDTLYFEPRIDEKIEFCCQFPDSEGEDVADIPQNHTNIVVRAVDMVREKCRIRHGCTIRLVKRIPSQAGMGGGSSDAALAIKMANKMWGLQLTTKEMMSLGGEIGSDVPQFFVDGISIGYGRGEQVEPVQTRVTLDFVVVKPPEGISTAEAFKRCVLSENEKRQTPNLLLQGLTAGNISEIGAGLFNRLETVSQALCQSIRAIHNAFAELDCVAHQMTGSGTACFAICRHQEHARHVAEQMKAKSLGKIYVVQSMPCAV